jgi:hypothetical protein
MRTLLALVALTFAGCVSQIFQGARPRLDRVSQSETVPVSQVDVPSRVVRNRSAYSEDQFIVGYGQSTAGLESAEVGAARDVASQISSQIKSRLVDLSSSSDGLDSQSVIVDTRVESGFAHNELIRVVRSESSCEYGLCKATAVLSRAEAVEVLKKLYEDASATFRLECDTALKHQADVVVVNRAFKRALSLYRTELERSGYQIEVIGRAGFAQWSEDRAKLRLVRSRLQQLAQGLKLSVVPRISGDRDVDARVSELLVGALGRLGVAAHFAPECTEGFALTYQAKMTFTDASVGGVKGMLTVHTQIKNCATDSIVSAMTLPRVASNRAYQAIEKSEREAKFRLLQVRLSEPLLAVEMTDFISDMFPSETSHSEAGR